MINMREEGTLTDKLSNKFLQLRWNHEEFEMSYSVLKNKLPIWKYYLEELFEEGEKPVFKTRIENPRHLWEELTIRFISSLHYIEKKRILESMILLY